MFGQPELEFFDYLVIGAGNRLAYARVSDSKDSKGLETLEY